MSVSMPEVAIYKDGDAARADNEVRVAKDIASVKAIPQASRVQLSA
jgi:hypothetical protein